MSYVSQSMRGACIPRDRPSRVVPLQLGKCRHHVVKAMPLVQHNVLMANDHIGRSVFFGSDSSKLKRLRNYCVRIPPIRMGVIKYSVLTAILVEACRKKRGLHFSILSLIGNKRADLKESHCFQLYARRYPNMLSWKSIP